jgi:hypothetical protein
MSTTTGHHHQCLSWMAFYWLALGVAVLLNAYSDVVMLQPYRYFHHHSSSVGDHYSSDNDDDDSPQQQPQQQHVSVSPSLSEQKTIDSVLKTNLSNTPLAAIARTTTTPRNHPDNKGSNSNSTETMTVLEILSLRRNAFYQNATLRAMLQANPTCHGKEELLSILYAAKSTGSSPAASSSPPSDVFRFLQDSCSKLAPWKQVTDLYGSKPIVVGMETCTTYRRSILLSQKGGASSTSSISSPRVRVAGLYNSGTTALAHALVDNLPRTKFSATAAGSALEEQIRQGQKSTASGNNSNSNTIISPGVPWGKHLPLKYKYINTFPVDNADDPDLVLPIVVVRDPYRWMQSMVRVRVNISISSTRTGRNGLVGCSQAWLVLFCLFYV